MTPSRILVLGSGGREHALAARLSADPSRPEVVVAPGNDGIALDHRCLALDPSDGAAVIAACRAESLDLVVVGPEAPLAAGIADALSAAGIAVFGPTRDAARLESSKWFAKEVMAVAGVPTARAEVYDDPRAAEAGLLRTPTPWVLKADGLAAGKGVLVTDNRVIAGGFVLACLSGALFGDGGRRLVVEEFLSGDEVSVMAVCDGERFVLLPTACDYKRAMDGDLGPNTGGMGAYCPASTLDAAGLVDVGRSIVSPTLAEMRRRGMVYRGVLYIGLMRTAAGLAVVEFNARFGDPEAQVILPGVDGDLVALLFGAAAGRLEPGLVRTATGATVAVALVDERYPTASAGGVVSGLDALRDRPGVFVRYAGGRRVEGGWQITGGRSAYVCATADARDAARERAYAAIATLGGHGWRCRSDIAAATGVASESGGLRRGAFHAT